MRCSFWQYKVYLDILMVGSEIMCILKQSAKWPFKVIQGHLFWYQSIARMQLPISHQ